MYHICSLFLFTSPHAEFAEFASGPCVSLSLPPVEQLMFIYIYIYIYIYILYIYIYIYILYIYIYIYIIPLSLVNVFRKALYGQK